MKKVFLFVVAAFAAVSLSAEPVQQDIEMTTDVWSWGYNGTATAVADGLQFEVSTEWGALSTGWDPEIDLTEWDKIIIIVESMEGCKGTWFYLKAYLRDHSESEAGQMEGLLGLDADPAVQNYLVIDLHQEKEGFDLTHARILAIQCQPVGGKFVVSRAYLEKEGKTAIENVSLQNNGIRYNMLGQEVDENYKGVVICNGQKMIVR